MCTDNDNITEKYAHFVNANSETTVKLIPIKKKLKTIKLQVIQESKKCVKMLIKHSQHLTLNPMIGCNKNYKAKK